MFWLQWEKFKKNTNKNWIYFELSWNRTHKRAQMYIILGFLLSFSKHI